MQLTTHLLLMQMATYTSGADHLGQAQDKSLDHKVCQEQLALLVRLGSQ
jgi:hypothetical protein